MNTPQVVNTWRDIPLRNYDNIQSILRIMYSAEMIASYDGVFYTKDGNLQDFHSSISSILPLQQELERLGLLEFWKTTALIVSSNELGIHGDGDPSYSHTIVLPIWNTEGTFTEFFSSEDGPTPTVLKHDDHDVFYDGYDLSKCQLIDRVEVLTPTLINVDTPHRVIHANPKGKVRVTAAIRLHGKESVDIALRKMYDSQLQNY